MRRAARIDDTQNAIVKCIRSSGFRVSITSTVGQGFPDLAVSFGGRTWLVELKDASKPKADRQLTPAQVKFHAAWLDEIAVLSTVAEAQEWCAAIIRDL